MVILSPSFIIFSIYSRFVCENFEMTDLIVHRCSKRKLGQIFHLKHFQFYQELLTKKNGNNNIGQMMKDELPMIRITIWCIPVGPCCSLQFYKLKRDPRPDKSQLSLSHSPLYTGRVICGLHVLFTASKIDKYQLELSNKHN